MLRNDPLLVLVGPTAAGKSRTSLELAARLGQAEIISADSRQIYRYMDIGTAKPTTAEQRAVPHRLLDVRNPDQVYSAGAFAADARVAIAQAHAVGRTPIVVGGSGMYVEALLDGLTPLPQEATDRARDTVRKRLQECGIDALYDQLSRADPQQARRVGREDVQRVTRALEQVELGLARTGAWTCLRCERWARPVVWCCLSRPRDSLYERIDRRAEIMVADGLLDETRRLLDMGYDERSPGLRTLGYAEALDGIRGNADRDAMLERIKQRTRRYAKRQVTWYRRDRRLWWIDLEAVGTAGAVERILRQLKRNRLWHDGAFSVDRAR
jgi:tRNA dimethylallyltransferase